MDHSFSPLHEQFVPASLAALSTGTVLGWTSQISQKLLDGDLGFSVSEDELGWIGSFSSLGAATLSLVIGSFCDLLGRKNTMLLMVLLMTAGWALLIWASSVDMLYIGRFITGMVGGAYCVTVPLYTNEIAEKEIRGALGCFTQLMISTGILFVAIISKYMNIQGFTIICGIIPVVFGVIFLFMPETPHHLMKRNNRSGARKALVWLRGDKHDVDFELKEIETSISSEERGNVYRIFRESFKKRQVRKACLIGVGLMVFKVLCAIDAITSYLSYIFDESGMGLDPQIGSIIFSTIQVVFAVVQALVVDGLGRRILLIVSQFTMALSLFIAAVAFLLTQRDLVPDNYATYINYLPLFFLCIFTIAFSFGAGPIPWMMCAEIFPGEIRSIMSSFCTFIVWILAFGVVKLFVVITASVGIDISFFIFGGLTALGFLFVYVIVPETKGKSLDEIQELLGR